MKLIDIIDYFGKEKLIGMENAIKSYRTQVKCDKSEHRWDQGRSNSINTEGTPHGKGQICPPEAAWPENGSRRTPKTPQIPL